MARRSSILAFALAITLGVALAGCGGGEEKAKEGEEATSARICDLPALSGSPKLPAHFPKPEGVTYRETSAAGPSQVVEGTYDGELDDAYDAYEQAVESSGYDVLFKEKEDEDAEISYDGENTTGQIALRDACGESDKLVVHITNRPK
jgi:hypothetical protein